MALQSSGQIKLSEIAAEFGGSAPHSLSEYYGDGNAPSSGEIQLAADFYGTSASLHTSTITTGSRNIKSDGSVTEHGYTSGHSNAGTGGDSFGSISNTAISGQSVTVVAAYFRNDTGSDVFRIAFSAAFTAWTSLEVKSGSTSIFSVNKSQMFDATGGSNTRWQYNYGGPGATNAFGSNGSTRTLILN
tara:strand:+ start:964 stop:1527 length:564 start_codon:yes stop_codon:yes gene_type:complete